MHVLRPQELWGKKAYDANGRHLGKVEAIAIGRDRVPRRIGVRVRGLSGIRFFSVQEARVDGERVSLAAGRLRDGLMRALPGGSR